MNTIIKAWRENDFSKAKKRLVETRMHTKAQGDELEWTPEGAFNDYVPSEEEKVYVQSILPQVWNKSLKEHERTICLSTYNIRVHVVIFWIQGRGNSQVLRVAQA